MNNNEMQPVLYFMKVQKMMNENLFKSQFIPANDEPVEPKFREDEEGNEIPGPEELLPEVDPELVPGLMDEEDE